MTTRRVHEESTDIIETSPRGRRVYIRIGGYGQGEGRRAYISQRDARRLAMHLLMAIDELRSPSG